MANYQAAITSQWPPDQTFGFLATFSNAALWDPGVLSGEQMDPGPVRPGTRFRLVVPFLGRRLTLLYRVTRLVPGREVVLEAASRLLRATDRITVSAHGGGAVVSYQAEVVLRGPLALLDRLLRRAFEQVGSRAAQGLARALSEPPAAPSRPAAI